MRATTAARESAYVGKDYSAIFFSREKQSSILVHLQYQPGLGLTGNNDNWQLESVCEKASFRSMLLRIVFEGHLNNVLVGP